MAECKKSDDTIKVPLTRIRHTRAHSALTHAALGLPRGVMDGLWGGGRGERCGAAGMPCDLVHTQA